MKDGKNVLCGELDIIDAKGKLWETYQVEIHYIDDFPHRFPTLYETGDKIPKIADWHIYEDTLACCVKVRPAEIMRCVNGITVSEYIEEEALPYLFNQTHRRLEGFYVNGEYAHGLKGIYEFYSQELKTRDDIPRTVQMMRWIAMNEKPVRTAQCFCGSEKKFRNCHRDAYERLKLVGDKALLSDCYTIGKAIGMFK